MFSGSMSKKPKIRVVPSINLSVIAATVANDDSITFWDPLLPTDLSAFVLTSKAESKAETQRTAGRRIWWSIRL
jgi:hypothetical protein